MAEDTVAFLWFLAFLGFVCASAFGYLGWSARQERKVLERAIDVMDRLALKEADKP